MSESIQAPPAANSRVLIITALITAITTIGVSFVGVVPQLRGRDAGTINELKKLLEEERLKQNPGPAGSGAAAAVIPPGKKKTIVGTVWSADGKRRLPNVDVILLPADGPRLMDQTLDNGQFMLPDIPSGAYSIIVLGADGKSGKTYLFENEEEVEVPGVLIKYRIRDKGEK